MLPKFIKNFKIVLRAALKGSEGREFDNPDVDSSCRLLLVRVDKGSSASLSLSRSSSISCSPAGS